MDLPLRFFLDGELYLLVERRDPSAREPGFQEVGRWEAEKVLAAALSHADAPELRRAGRDDAASEGGWDDRHDASRRLRSRFDSELEQLVLLRRRKPTLTLTLAKPEAVVDISELAPDDDRKAGEGEETWIEVLVLDDADQPMANVEYEIELSDGRVQRGRTDEHGMLRYEDLPTGSCKVRLLDVDGRGWDVG